MFAAGQQLLRGHFKWVCHAFDQLFKGSLTQNGFIAVLKPALEAAELPDIRFHDLRHTYAGIQLTVLKHNLISVSKQMGHSKPSVRMDTYTHLNENSDPHAAEKYDDVLFGYIES
jgi:integrase